ncbi:MAG: tripartite tricarboxylate transporter TctB family protein, partial [Methylobacteriaceae bacterium]|nr:tripartite tricarboxylate transporter TctB family protein [Methylobacteriaceae bacterium]
MVSGLALLALAGLALWLSRDLPSGTLRAIGPGLMPRWLAFGVGACGLGLAAIGVVRTGSSLERWTFRGPALVTLAILAFALTIRPTPIGPVSSPGLGLAFAGPLSVLI